MSDILIKELGERIRSVRKERNMTLHDLQEATGMSNSALSKVERGAVVVGADNLYAISKTLGVSIDWLITGNAPAINKINELSYKTKKLDNEFLINEVISIFNELSRKEREDLFFVIKGAELMIKRQSIRNKNEAENNTSKITIEKSGYNYSNESKMINLPVLGVAAAGAPMEAIPYIEGYLEVQEKYKDCFIVRIKGDSMINAGMENGGYALVRQQQVVESGEVALVMVDNNVTIKRFKREGEKVVLIPENDNMSPMVYTKSLDVKILGKVVKWYSAQEAANIFKEEI